MLKHLAEKLLGRYGLEVVKEAEQEPQPVRDDESSVDALLRRHCSAISTDPLNADLHLRYAIDAARARLPYLAFAELRTHQWLAGHASASGTLEAEFASAIPDAATINHNQYFRLASLAAEIRHAADGESMSVLDVGGGDGRLASFVPELSYCLAEPTFNGISGTDLPFPDYSFDYVVSCHVLEHIPLDDRSIFLDQLLAKAKRGVILLNPFHVEGSYADQATALVLDITRAAWAKEHLDCTLPNIDEIRSYAEARGLELSIKPNGTGATTLALVFVDYFAAQAGRYEEWTRINAFFNEKLFGLLDSANFPTAHLVHLKRPMAWEKIGA